MVVNVFNIFPLFSHPGAFFFFLFLLDRELIRGWGLINFHVLLNVAKCNLRKVKIEAMWAAVFFMEAHGSEYLQDSDF